jgi:RNA 2',3'-cyclic 3'-phosphodiesterase
MRAFVAIDVPPLEAPVVPELRPEDHITLQFFAELAAERVPSVVGAMAAASAGIAPFEIECRGIGAFPTPDRPRVIWAGIGEGASALVGLVDRLRRGLAERGFPAEQRPFVPHLTLARIRSGTAAAWARRFLAEPGNASRAWTRTRVTEILLKESELRPDGARHTVRERVRLPSPLAPVSGPPEPPLRGSGSPPAG